MTATAAKAELLLVYAKGSEQRCGGSSPLAPARTGGRRTHSTTIPARRTCLQTPSNVALPRVRLGLDEAHAVLAAVDATDAPPHEALRRGAVGPWPKAAWCIAACRSPSGMAASF
jgi:hypothetical protein